jgi:cellulose synthase/poly-beta-1,6-N-acetylglucosamine synthase-like glycosyltransferase
MGPLQTTAVVLNLLALTLLFVYSANCYVLVLACRRRRREALVRCGASIRRFHGELAAHGWPRVTVQLPLYNERYVVERLIDAVCRLDYPRDRLEIQVLDDSTDDTAARAESAVRRAQARGVNIVRMARSRRDGYKAGALRDGLRAAGGEFIAVFDADFLPAPDFLKATIPYFGDPALGMLQARWGHLNAGHSLLTRLQAIGIDGHFAVEQAARAWSGWFMNFNGSGGVWRRRAIEDAGGWQADTLTEDLDLSYRAQLAGWKLMAAPQIVCPGELPVTMDAFKSQQHRWAKGSIQTAKKTLGGVLHARLPWPVKAQAVLHLTRYLVHPLILLVVLLSIPTLHSPFMRAYRGAPVLFFILLWLSTLGPSALYLSAQRLLYPDWKARLKYLPALMCLGSGLAVNNTLAVLEAFLNLRSPFVRTPKFGILRKGEAWQGKHYGLPLRAAAFAELGVGLYALSSFGFFLFAGTVLPSPFLMIYAVGFLSVFMATVRHSRPHARKETVTHDTQGLSRSLSG